MIIQLLLREGGEWWQVQIPNVDAIKDILNTGKYLGQQIHALLIFHNAQPMIYDFALCMWR